MIVSCWADHRPREPVWIATDSLLSARKRSCAPPAEVDSSLGRRIARGNGGWPSLRASRRSNPSPPERPWGEPGYSPS